MSEPLPRYVSAWGCLHGRDDSSGCCIETPPMMREEISHSVKETEEIARKFAKTVKPGDIVCLLGTSVPARPTLHEVLFRPSGSLQKRSILPHSPSLMSMRGMFLSITWTAIALSTIAKRLR